MANQSEGKLVGVAMVYHVPKHCLPSNCLVSQVAQPYSSCFTTSAHDRLDITSLSAPQQHTASAVSSMQVFCHPPVATVGLSEEAAVEQLTGDVEVYVEQFKTMLHTLAGRHERSFIKMIVHKGTDIVVGVHMVGLDAPSTMQAVAVALKAGVKKEHFDSTLGIHPTAAQELVGMERPARTVKGQGTVTPGMPTGTELQKALA
jgi:hypothetical protein